MKFISNWENISGAYNQVMIRYVGSHLPIAYLEQEISRYQWSVFSPDVSNGKVIKSGFAESIQQAQKDCDECLKELNPDYIILTDRLSNML